MTPRALRRSSYTVFAVGLITLVCWWTLVGRHSREAWDDDRYDLTRAGEFTIDIEGLVGHLQELPSQEVRDQLRDWAVLGTLAQIGANADARQRTSADEGSFGRCSRILLA